MLRPSLVAIVSVSRLVEQLNVARVDYNQENKEHEECMALPPILTIHLLSIQQYQMFHCHAEWIVMEVIASRCASLESYQQRMG